MRLHVRFNNGAAAVVIAAAVSLGVAYAAASAMAGIATFAVAVLIILSWRISACEARCVLRDAERAGHRFGAREQRLVLLVAGDTPSADQLQRELMRTHAPAPVLEVLAPVLPPSDPRRDVASETAAAASRLDEILAWASARGLRAHGELGDPRNPVGAIVNELRSHDVDEVVVATHAPEEASSVEAAIVECLREQLATPLSELVARG